MSGFLFSNEVNGNASFKRRKIFRKYFASVKRRKICKVKNALNRRYERRW